MKRIIPILILVLGCKRIEKEPIIVKVPVPIECPKVVLPDRPILPVVQNGDDVATMVKKMAVGIAMLVSENEQLRALLAPYSKPAPPIKPLDLNPSEKPKIEAKL